MEEPPLLPDLREQRVRPVGRVGRHLGALDKID